jgi:predicted small integral membrane protein
MKPFPRLFLTLLTAFMYSTAVVGLYSSFPWWFKTLVVLVGLFLIGMISFAEEPS